MSPTHNLPANRQLACVMFSDIVGYTLLMGDDENEAYQVLRRNREIQRPIIEAFGGRWIKELGDGVLATFSSVTNAVLAAAEIQLACREQVDFQLRIGIHLSEVIFENNDVFGDGVNIAARMQSVAPEGGIVISEAVQKNLINKRGIETRNTGTVSLKHVREPVNIYEVVITDDYVSHPSIATGRNARKAQKNSIAVLPFRNLSRDEEQEYFGDGIAEEIIITLSNIDNLKVVGRRSSFQFKHTELQAVEIGRMLGVSHILEGSVVRRNSHDIRIYVELINAADGTQIWGEKYDREITDIFHIQDDIASNIAKKLMVSFFEDDTRVIPVNMEAYELLLKGRYFIEKFIEGFEKANACLMRAVEIDPNYGEAYAELAKLHFLTTMNLFQAPMEGFERAKYFAEKALSLNPELGGAHYLLGQVNFWYKWDFAKSKAAYEMAERCTHAFYFTGVVIDPWYKAFGQGDFQGAIQSIFKIIETDPLSFYAQLHLAYFYTFGGQAEKAREVLNRMLAMAPDFSEAERLVAYNYLLENDHENALVHAEKAATMARGLGWAQNLYIITLARCGQKEKALQLLADYEAQKGPLTVSPLGIGLVYSHMGDFDKAFEYYNKAIEFHDIWAVAFKHSREFDHVRHDPRFQGLLDRIGYPS